MRTLLFFCLALGWQSIALALDAEVALQSHNLVRQQVNDGVLPGQPAASPVIPLLSWDQNLADRATAYAGQCIWAHSDDRVNEGENLAYSTGLSFSIDQAVGLWADEYVGYDFASGACSVDACGHYTQLVWHNTMLVGCGDAVCAPMRAPSGTILASRARYHVCRYATAGNIGRERPYSTDGGVSELVAGYSDVTRELTVPYALIWQPNNRIQPTGAVFKLVSGDPIRFELSALPSRNYVDDLRVSTYDVNSRRLFLPQVDTFLGGNLRRNSAVLHAVPGGDSFQLELEYFR